MFNPTTVSINLAGAFILLVFPMLVSAADHSDYYQSGELTGSLKSSAALPIYDKSKDHLWNRLFAAFYIRESQIASKAGGKPIKRIEGGDFIDFLSWGRTTHWTKPQVVKNLNSLLDRMLAENENSIRSRLIDDPLKRAIMLRDLWAVHDSLTNQNIRRFGDRKTRARRDGLCRKLARVIQSLALSNDEIKKLPDTYRAAIQSEHFAEIQNFETDAEYLPHGLLTEPNEWVEIDFFQPDLHEDLSNRFVTMHTRIYRGRSYFRIFYRFPKGREQVMRLLSDLDRSGVDWRQAAQNGFILLKKDAPQIPVGTEVALVQFMMTLNRELQPVPTKIVESIRHRAYRNVDGSGTPETNTGVGMHVTEYTMKRRLLFNNLKHGGLEREPADLPQYRVIFQPQDAKDWGTDGRKVLFQQCADCHMSPRANRIGVHSMPSIVNMGGFDVGAQLGVARPLDPDKSETRGKRAAKWKLQHETYRRLLDYVGR